LSVVYRKIQFGKRHKCAKYGDIDEEEHYHRLREMLYNGDLVAADGGETISLILPVDIVP